MKRQSFRYNEMNHLQTLPFETKLKTANELIKTEIQNAKRVAVACSFGKDSMMLLHLALSIDSNILVMFHNTGVQYQETYRYRDLILQEWNIKNYVETKPIMSFWKCVDKYGFPDFRKRDSRTPACCYYLKEKPAINLIKEKKIDLEIVGLQASESMFRRLSFLREGYAFNSKKYGCRIVRPIMTWLDKDIWQYHKMYNIPHNSLYDKMARNGCQPCTGFRNWKQQLARINPKMYVYISRRIGEPTLLDYLGVECK